MVILLFLATFCVFFFVPVNFRIYYKKMGQDDLFIYEMTFLKGLLKRRKVVSLIEPISKEKAVKNEKFSGRWFFMKKAQVKKKSVQPPNLNSHGLREFLQKYQNFGIGVTLLSYFLPVKYQRWLLVTEDLEKRGKIHKLVWKTCVGTGEAFGTSIIYGALWGVKATLVKYLQNKIGFAQKPVVEVFADYKNNRLDTIFDCIFRINLGYIIIASLLARLRLRLLKGGVF